MQVLILCGCETVKIILGTSIQHLEEARSEASVANFRCGFNECFDAVLSLARNEYAGDSYTGDTFFDVFQKDRVRSFIVVMGIKDNIDTTEVGIFFVEKDLGVQVEISSLSSSAKRKVKEAVFNELNLRFTQN